MYDPNVGQFLSVDPIEDDGENLYRYVGNSPTNATDPTGLSIKMTSEQGIADAEALFKNMNLPVFSKLKAGSAASYSDIENKIVRPRVRGVPTKDDLVREIIIGMVKSDRRFEFASEQDLRIQIDARLAIIRMAQNSKVHFGVENVLDKRFYNEKGEFVGKSMHSAILEMSKPENQSHYVMGCGHCSVFMGMAGIASAIDAATFDKLYSEPTPADFRAGQFGALFDVGQRIVKDDWIPGDIGYVENISFSKAAEELRKLTNELRVITGPKGTLELAKKAAKQTNNYSLVQLYENRVKQLNAAFIPKAEEKVKSFRKGMEGENIIYMGNGQWWGHLRNEPTYHSTEDWIKNVSGWGTDGAQVAPYRLSPSLELKK